MVRSRWAMTMTLLFVSSFAHGEESEHEAAAAMRRGMAAFARGDAEAALVEYARAKHLAPRANLPYRYAAEAHQALGHWAEAIGELEGYLSIKNDVADADLVRRKIVLLRAERLPGRLRIRANASHVTVTWDDQPEQVRAVPTVLSLAPGDHMVRVRGTDFDVRKKVHVVGDVETQWDIANIAATSTEDASRREPTPNRVVPLAILGGGVVLVVASAATDLFVLGPAVDRSREASSTGAADASSLRDDASSLRTGVTAGYVVGAVAVAAGGIWLWRIARPNTTSTSIRLRAGGFIAEGRF